MRRWRSPKRRTEKSLPPSLSAFGRPGMNRVCSEHPSERSVRCEVLASYAAEEYGIARPPLRSALSYAANRDGADHTSRFSGFTWVRTAAALSGSTRRVGGATSADAARRCCASRGRLPCTVGRASSLLRIATCPLHRSSWPTPFAYGYLPATTRGMKATVAGGLG